MDHILISLFSNLGLGVTSNAIYDKIKSFVKTKQDFSLEEFDKALQEVLIKEKLHIRTEQILDILVQNKLLECKSSHFEMVAIDGGRIIANDRTIIGHNIKAKADGGYIDFSRSHFEKPTS